MKNFKINANNIAMSDNHIEITIPDNLKYIKIVDAILNAKISSIPSNNNCIVNYSAKKENTILESWNNVDTMKNVSAGTISINISDELQNTIDLNAKLILDFIGNGEIIFDNSESNIAVDYISIEEYQSNGNSQNIDLEKSGNATINLATGQLNITTPLISSDENVLPISINANFNSTKNTKLPDIGLPNKWSLNVNQFLIKNGNDDEKLRFTYIDENGKNQIIEEKYYYVDENNDKIFVNRNQVTVDLDGNLKYEDKEIKISLEAPSGLKLVSSIEGLNGSNLVDYEPEELIQVKENIKQLEKQKESYKNNIYNYQKQLCLLAMSKFISFNNNIATYNSNYPHDEAEANSLTITTENIDETFAFDDDFTSAMGSEELEEEIFDKIYKREINEDLFQETIFAFIDKAYFKDFANNSDKSVVPSIFKEFENTSKTRGIYYTEKLNLQSYDKHKYGVCTTYNDNNFYSIDVQINNYKEQLILLKDQLGEIENELSKYYHQQEQYEMQIPVHYLYNDDNIFYGFGKTNNENLFRLVLIMDAYENAIYFSYKSLDSHKIESIVDTNEKSIVFDYNKEFLSEIVDARDRKVTFNYNDKNELQLIKHVDNTNSYFYYTENEEQLKAVLNQTSIGVEFSYNNKNKVSNVSMISFLDNVTNNVITYKKLNDDDFSFEKLDFSNNDYSIFKISDKSISFDYKNYKSTTLTNSKNKQVTYLFDKLGKVRTIYENNFNENSLNDDEIVFKATEFTYQDNKINMKVTALPYSENYLSDVAFKENEKSIENGFYLGTADTLCSSTTIPYLYDVNAKFYKISASETTKALTVSMSSENIKTLNNDISSKIICPHRTFMVSGWAKADSAFVITDEQTKDEDNNALYPDYINNRKFEIRVNVTYEDGEKENPFIRQFDWRNTEWQYCSIAFTLKDKAIQSIESTIDYSENTGDIMFTDLSFKQADIEVTDYDSSKCPIKSYSAHSDFVKTYEYADAETTNPYKQIITNKLDSNKKYTTIYEYTKEGKLLRTIDYNGIVKENVYNDQGIVIKTITYHKDEPTNKFYEEKKLDEKGKEIDAINELGEKTNTYEYINGTGIISSSTDENGVKTSYGYSPADTLLETTITANGIENTNTYGYNLDFLTSLKHNDFEIGYDYDYQGRTKQINIAENKYLTKYYKEDEETTSLASNESYRQTFNDNGDVLATYYKPNKTASETTLVENVYDTYGNITISKDLIENNTHTYYYDKFGNTVKETNSQHGQNITIENVMDNSHSNIKTSTITIGTENLDYIYDRDETPDAKLFAIILPGGIEQTINYDKLQRVKEIQTLDFAKQFTYLKNGDHTTNLISKLLFAISNETKDNLTYKYDKKGNIIEIRENNKFLARYKYDALSRIIREDNSVFNKTYTYSYDAGGNITQRNEYAFTLSDNLDFETSTNSFDYSYPTKGWKDHLLAYNGEKFVYDALGNPTTYRNKTLTWSHGRQLDKFSDIAEYKYNASGIRTSKAINVNMLECNCGKEDCDCNGTFTTSFFLNGNKIIRQHDCCNDLTFYYGSDGVTSFQIKNNIIDETFYYKKNAQNDIIGIYSTNGKQIARYDYDAWGNCVVKYLQDDGTYGIITSDYCYNDTSIINRFIAFKNPFRYRSYYYDFETNLYYLNSRYYDPEIGRFINADDITTLDITQIALNGLNLYAYCLNNPVNQTDDNGNIPNWLKWLLGGIIVLVAVVTLVVTGGAASGLFGAIVVGAAKGALIGAGIGLTTGTITGVITGDWSGLADSFMWGAISGLVSGGISGGFGYASSKGISLVGDIIGKSGKVLGNKINIGLQIATSVGTYIGETFTSNDKLSVAGFVFAIIGGVAGGTYFKDLASPRIINIINSLQDLARDIRKRYFPSRLFDWLM